MNQSPIKRSGTAGSARIALAMGSENAVRAPRRRWLRRWPGAGPDAAGYERRRDPMPKSCR